MARLIVQPRARVDIDEAVAWYHARDPDLASRILSELDRVFARVSENPAQFPTIGDSVHRALLKRFPYSVYFVQSGDLVAVVAVLHHSRKPVDWGKR